MDLQPAMSTEITAPATIAPDPITTALVAAGVTTARIDKLKEEYGALVKITAIQTPEQYEVVKKAQLDCRDVRVAVEAALKLERDAAVKYQRFVLQEEKRVLALISPVEDPLKKLLSDWDHRKELAAQEEVRKWTEKMQVRKEAVYDAGFTFNGSQYICDKEDGTGSWVLNEDQITGGAVKESELFDFLEKVKEHLQTTREIKAEAAARAREEQEAITKKAAELAEKERRLNERIAKARIHDVTLAGGMRGPSGTGFGDLRIHDARLITMSDEEFAGFLGQVTERKREWDDLLENVRVEAEELERRSKAEAANNPGPDIPALRSAGNGMWAYIKTLYTDHLGDGFNPPPLARAVLEEWEKQDNAFGDRS